MKTGMTTKRLGAILMMVVGCSTVFAANFNYNGNGADPNDWFDEANWTDPVAATNFPTAGDKALFTIFDIGINISQVIPVHGQLQVGRGAANTVTIETSGAVTNLGQTIVGILDNGKGTLVIDGGELVTKVLRINVGAGGIPVEDSLVQVRNGLLHVDLSIGGLNAGDAHLGMDSPGAIEVSGGSLVVDSNFNFDEGQLIMVGTNGSMSVGNEFRYGTSAASETEVGFFLGKEGGVSAINADSISFAGLKSLVVNGVYCETAKEQNLVLFNLVNDSFSPSELNALSNALKVVNIKNGELSLSGDGKQLLFSGTPLSTELVKGWEFNTAGDTEDFLAAGHGHIEGLMATNDIAGSEGVLTSEDIVGIDPQIWINQYNTNSALHLTSEGGSWQKAEIRLRQIDGNPDAVGVASQPFESIGSLLSVHAPDFINFGVIAERATCKIENQSNNWIVATYDISNLGTNTINRLRLDPIAWNTNGNFEVDYIRMYVGIDPLLTDSDGDGMPDVWEETYGLNPAVDDAGLHADADTLTNLEEYTHGTNPLNPDTDDDGLFDDEEVNTYGTYPTSKDTDADGMPDKWEVDNLFDPTPGGAGDALLNADGDGLNNLEEFQACTDPRDSDTDDDTLDDYVELNVSFTNPLEPDSDFDGLGDEIENIEQDYGKTDPNDPDSDDDGVLDGTEVANGTDPLDDDSDDDGLLDGEEATHGTNPLDADSDDDGLNDGAEIAAGTLPLNPDTDGDGALDGWEVANGLNPTDPNDDPDKDEDGILDTWETSHFGLITACDPGGDADSDNYTNLMEFQNGTDPNMVDLYIEDFPAIEVSWISMAGTNYQVQMSSDLSSSNWVDVGSTVVGDGQRMGVSIPTRDAENKSFRVLMNP